MCISLGIFAVFNIGCKAKNTKWCHYPAFFMEGSFFIFAFHQIRTVSDTERLLDIIFCKSQKDYHDNRVHYYSCDCSICMPISL